MIKTNAFLVALLFIEFHFVSVSVRADEGKLEENNVFYAELSKRFAEARIPFEIQPKGNALAGISIDRLNCISISNLLYDIVKSENLVRFSFPKKGVEKKKKISEGEHLSTSEFMARNFDFTDPLLKVNTLRSSSEFSTTVKREVPRVKTPVVDSDGPVFPEAPDKSSELLELKVERLTLRSDGTYIFLNDHLEETIWDKSDLNGSIKTKSVVDRLGYCWESVK